jgi:hypothetical protein
LKLVVAGVACLCVGICIGLGVGPAATPARASQVASDIKLDPDDLSQPLVLDQNGRLIHLPTAQHPGPVVLPAGSVATYLAYNGDSDDTMPTGLAVVQGDPAKAAHAVGPLHLDPLDRSQLDQALAQSGEALVHTTDNTRVLVKPIASGFGSAGTTSTTSGLAWLAARAAAARTGTSSSNSSASSTSGSSSSAPQATPPSSPQAQTLIPSSVSSSFTNNHLIRDLQHLVQLKSGKLVNWNQQSLEALKRDLSLGTPQNVAPRVVASGTRTAAQELAPLGSSSSGTGGPQPAPVPEPGTLVVFSLVAGLLVLRQKLVGRVQRVM